MGRYDALLQSETNQITQAPTEISERARNDSENSPHEEKINLTPLPPTLSDAERTRVVTPARPTAVSSVRAPVRVKRTITRYAFEFFHDQLEALKKFSLDEQLRGEKGSMSQMVREALDAYIAKRYRTHD